MSIGRDAESHSPDFLFWRMPNMKNSTDARASGPPVARRWVNFLLGGGVLASLASFLYPAFRYIIPPSVPESTSRSVVAAKVNELKRNSSKIFQFGSKPALLIRTANDEYKAISAVCTHLSCTVQYGKTCTRSGALATTVFTMRKAATSAARRPDHLKSLMSTFRARTLLPPEKRNHARPSCWPNPMAR